VITHTNPFQEDGMNSIQRLPVQVWTPADVSSLKWGSILFGVGVGLILPRGLRRFGLPLTFIAGAFALKPLMALLREDSVICADRPTHDRLFRDAMERAESSPPLDLEGAGSA